MTIEDVLAVERVTRKAGVNVWLDGGWGLDALLGAQHRPHDDLDVVVALDDVERLCEALAPLGYHITDHDLPTRAVLRANDRRQVDLHPLTFDATGNGWQARAMPNGDDCIYPARDFTVGHIGGIAIGCLSAELQVIHHLGYVPRPHDYEDMARLAARFALNVPAPYATHRN